MVMVTVVTHLTIDQKPTATNTHKHRDTSVRKALLQTHSKSRKGQEVVELTNREDEFHSTCPDLNERSLF